MRGDVKQASPLLRYIRLCDILCRPRSSTQGVLEDSGGYYVIDSFFVLTLT